MTQTEWAIIWIVWWLSIAQILEYFSISSEWLIIMTVMLVLDFIFWIVAAKARWERIESRKWQYGLVKKLTRRLLPFIVVAGLKWTGLWWIEELVHVIIGMIVFSELYSIIGHIYSINYWQELPEVDAFKMLLNGLVKLLKNLIDKKDKDLSGNDSEDVGDESSEG